MNTILANSSPAPGGGARCVLLGGPLDGQELDLPPTTTEISINRLHYVRADAAGTQPCRYIYTERRWMIGYNGTPTISRFIATVWASDLESALGKARAMASAALGVPEADLEAPVAEEVGS